jgi:S1-C subfamily serine protease
MTKHARRVFLGTVGALGAAGAIFGAAQASGTTVISGQGQPAFQLAPARSGQGGTAYQPATSTTGTATAQQEIGVVDINTVLGYQEAAAAGTGLVLTSTGEILTNNHVIDGATSIKVTVVTSGATYTATVVGTDPTADVAVLQLSNASGLQTAHLSTAQATVGEAVTAVGNAGGTGGTPSSATGTVTALGQSITAADQGGGNAEQLSGLIETNADIQAGDSGGPLFDSADEVIGIDTAASSGQRVQGYAIPISTAVSIARQIEAGVSSATIHQGYPAFLGVSVEPDGDGGALIAGVLSGGPAASAGITAGDVVTAVGGTGITSPSELSTALATYRPGQTVTVTWTAQDGSSQSAAVTLARGPAD